MKVLLLDLEVAPNLAYVWGLFKQNVAINQIAESAYVLTWAAKWLDDDKVSYGAHWDDEDGFLDPLYDMVGEADAVVHYNGTSFDMPLLNQEFLLREYAPPSPWKDIDLLRTVRRKFRFPSNKLDYVAQRLGVGAKVNTGGFELWTGCMYGDKKSQAKMIEYNIQDVELLEDLYYKLQPWIVNHPNRQLYDDVECPQCGSDKLKRKGYTMTGAGRYERYQCGNCGSWHRGKKADKTTNQTPIR